jgi:hypothetical protein
MVAETTITKCVQVPARDRSKDPAGEHVIESSPNYAISATHQPTRFGCRVAACRPVHVRKIESGESLQDVPLSGVPLGSRAASNRSYNTPASVAGRSLSPSDHLTVRGLGLRRIEITAENARDLGLYRETFEEAAQSLHLDPCVRSAWRNVRIVEFDPLASYIHVGCEDSLRPRQAKATLRFG